MKKKYIEIPNVGEFICAEFMEPLGLSQNALAKAINVPQNRISDIINGNRGITADTDLRLCRYFGLSDGIFAGMQFDFDQMRAKRELEKELDEIVPYANDNDGRERVAM
jgi:addiction module HigA family antidote